MVTVRVRPRPRNISGVVPVADAALTSAPAAEQLATAAAWPAFAARYSGM